MAKISANAKTRLLTYLSKADATLTVAQARARFKIANPTAVISDIRKDGYNIITEMRECRDGVERAVYSLAQRKTARKTVRSTVRS
jgi:hypothetical protein